MVEAVAAPVRDPYTDGLEFNGIHIANIQSMVGEKADKMIS